MIVFKEMLLAFSRGAFTPATSRGDVPEGFFASDLMSDVLTAAEPGRLLLTGSPTATCQRLTPSRISAGIVFVQGKRRRRSSARPWRKTPLMATKMTMFDACAGSRPDRGRRPWPALSLLPPRVPGQGRRFRQGRQRGPAEIKELLKDLGSTRRPRGRHRSPTRRR